MLSSHPDGDDQILTTREAAKLLGIAVSTAQQWIENGALPAWKTPGGHRLVRLADVRALQRERTGLKRDDVDDGADPLDFLPDADSALPIRE